MAQERPDTPEKQLLKLIEDPKSKTASKAQAVKRKGISLFSPGAWLGRTSFLKKGLGSWLKSEGLKLLNVKVLNRTLGLCNFMLIAYLAVNFSNSMIEFKNKPDLGLSAKIAKKSPEIIEVASLLKDEPYYLNKIGERNIFEMGKIESDDIIGEPQVQLTPTASPAIEATQHLKLVGISWSNEPDAMVEDTRALRTFFVKKGQLVGEVRVKDILRDRIILTYQGDEVELR
ncbi:MAG: hypothetical protein ABH843_02960 [Candidatus Omnitrophota bacterium]